MRRSLLVLGMLGAACAATMEDEELELLDFQDAPESFQVVPDEPEDLEFGPPLPDEDAPVRIEVSRFDSKADPLWADGTARCPFEVTGVGLPAIRDDGSSVANLWNDSDNGEGDDELVMLDVLDVETGEFLRRDELVHGIVERSRSDCRRWYEQALAKADELNASLARGWRPMRTLPVEVDPRLHPLGPEDGVEEHRPPNERPVQLTLLHGQVVFRVRGVKVLERFIEDWWQPEDDDPEEGTCRYAGPNPKEVVVDDDTGFAMISVEYQGVSCMCDSPIGREFVRLSADTIAEIDRRGAFVEVYE